MRVRRSVLVALLAVGCAPAPLDGDGGRPLDAAEPMDAGFEASVPDASSSRDAPSSPDASFALPPCAFADVFVNDALDVSEPLSEGYVVPTEARLGALARSIDLAIDGDREGASDAASEASYELCQDRSLLVWRPTDATGQARIAWRTDATRSLILEAPHPFFDTDTLAEASALFDRLGARVLIASGTHRCASAAPGCEGSSSACGDPSGFRRSDAAHNVIATYHRAHARFADRFASDVVVGVHGFADVGASVSDGTTDPVTLDAPVARLARALVDAGITGVTSCNSGAGVDVDARMCGTTDAQGRHVNGSADACGASAAAASGRFVHLEQSRDVRASIDLVASAFEAAF